MRVLRGWAAPRKRLLANVGPQKQYLLDFFDSFNSGSCEVLFVPVDGNVAVKNRPREIATCTRSLSRDQTALSTWWRF